jgi:hypothetical protein
MPRVPITAGKPRVSATLRKLSSYLKFVLLIALRSIYDFAFMPASVHLTV